MSRFPPGTDFSIYEPDSLTGGTPVIKNQWQENVDRDQFHSDIEWDLGRTDYEPATGAYVAPWDKQGWGSNDVVLTPPRNPGNYVPPSRPAIQEGQRDYVYMPTEKEQWRIGDENKRRQAAAVGKDWRESRLPRPVPEEPKEKVYPDWRETEIPERREVTIQPVFGDKPWDSKIPERRGEPYQDDSMWKKYPRREREVTIQPVPRREIKGGGRGPSHKDFDHRGGFNTQALVPWINRETGEKWTAPDGGYSPREGSGWIREREIRAYPADNESRKTRRPSLRDTLMRDMGRRYR